MGDIRKTYVTEAKKDCFFPEKRRSVAANWHPLCGWGSFTISPSKIFRLFERLKQSQNRSNYLSMHSGEEVGPLCCEEQKHS